MVVCCRLIADPWCTSRTASMHGGLEQMAGEKTRPPWSAAGATAAAASSPAGAPSASESASESSLLSSGGSRTPFTSPWASARHSLSVTYERPVRYIRETPENETRRDDERHLHPLSVPQNSFSTLSTVSLNRVLGYNLSVQNWYTWSTRSKSVA